MRYRLLVFIGGYGLMYVVIYIAPPPMCMRTAKTCKSINKLWFPLSVAQTIAKCPFTPGHEAVGEVSAITLPLPNSYVLSVAIPITADRGSRTKCTS